MKNKAFDDANWREEYKGMKVLSKYQIELLENGATSLSSSWLLGAMYSDWKRKKGYREPEPPNLQSSFKEWNDKANQQS